MPEGVAKVTGINRLLNMHAPLNERVPCQCLRPCGQQACAAVRHRGIVLLKRMMTYLCLGGCEVPSQILVGASVLSFMHAA
eukprot:123115-Pelagomonas_calceolata.AAC.2